jgi:hypothetical protein
MKEATDFFLNTRGTSRVYLQELLYHEDGVGKILFRNSGTPVRNNIASHPGGEC